MSCIAAAGPPSDPLRAEEDAGVRGPERRPLLASPPGREGPPTIVTPAGWRERRGAILRGMERAMGTLPAAGEAPELEPRIHDRVRGAQWERRAVSFRTEGTRRVPAHLWLPLGDAPAGGRPAALALHPTHPAGKGVVGGLTDRPHRQYALDLVRRGWVVLAPDYPSFGDYAHDFDADDHPSGTIVGVIDGMRAVDYLATLAEVDADRICAIGHSLGGHNAMFLAAFDERIRAAVSSCGWTLFDDYYDGNLRGWTSDRYMPRIASEFGSDPALVPFDFHEVIAAIAPRPFLSISPAHDSNFAVAGVRAAIPAARDVYRLLGAPEALEVRYPECGHDFPPAERDAAYEFLDRAVRRDPSMTPRREGSDAAEPTGALHAGIATVDITPPRGFRMSGYFHERANTGTHDPLRATAIALRQGEVEVVWVFCDLIGIADEVSSRVRREVHRATGVAEGAIAVCATHSHTGPLYFGVLRDLFHARSLVEKGRDPLESSDYTDELSARVADACVRARGLLAPAGLRFARARAPEVSFNRRFHMEDGTVRFNPGKLNPRIVRVAGPIDPSLDVLALEREDGAPPFAALTRFALHLDTVGGTEYSADFPHWIERSLRAELGADFEAIFAAGACGDINHIDVSHDRPQKGQGEARRIGEALAVAALGAIERGARVDARLAWRSARVTAPLQQYDDAAVRAARRDLEQVGTSALPFLERVRAYKIIDLERRSPREHIELEVQVVRLSDELAWVLLPGEVFVDLALDIERRSPFTTTAVVELANSAPGYVPTRRAFREGSYETVNSRIAPGGGEALVDAAVELLEALHEDD